MPLWRDEPGPPPPGTWAVVERAASAALPAPAASVADLRGGRWEVEGEPEPCWTATVEDGRLRSESYPDPLARVFSALSAPHAGDFVVSLAPGFEAVDWGGVTHAGGGSHGALQRRRLARPAALRRLRPGVRRRARAVDAARRRAGGPASTSGPELEVA